jgi:hypothetical protein
MAAGASWSLPGAGWSPAGARLEPGWIRLEPAVGTRLELASAIAGY